MPTLTVYPDADPETSTIDGEVERTGVDEAFTTIRGGAGNGNNSTATPIEIRLLGSTTTDQFQRLERMIALFDTSSIGSGQSIDSATLSLYGINKLNGLGSPDLHIVASSPASNTVLANSDYGNVSFTDFGSVTYASFTTSAYNDITLNASGEANIDTNGISKFGAILDWDLDNSFGGTWANSTASRFQVSSADETGTTQDPKLVVNYSSAFTPKMVVIQ